jgi:hypothetical protein
MIAEKSDSGEPFARQTLTAVKPSDALDNFKRGPNDAVGEDFFKAGNPLFRKQSQVGLEMVSYPAQVLLEHSILLRYDCVIEIQPAHQGFAAMPNQVERPRTVLLKPMGKGSE